LKSQLKPLLRRDLMMLRPESELIWVGLLALLSLLAASKAGADEIRFDFESGDLQGWEVMEGRFDKLICDRDVFHNAPAEKYNKQGRYFLSTLERSDGRPDDALTGVIESPVFVLTDPAISFWVGGGAHPDTYVALCTEDGQEIFKAHGQNTEVMRKIEWDAADMMDRKVFLCIVDRNTGSWGHITFDDFRATGRIDPEATEALRKSYGARQQARIERERALAGKRAQERAKRLKELLSEEGIFARGEPRIYRGEHLDAISLTVGGIGSGSIQIDGKARRSVWQIFNNMTQAFVPDSFFAVRVRFRGEKPLVRALQTARAGPFGAMKALGFRGEYPFGWFVFEDPDLPVKITLETFHPLIPMEAKDSAMPCAVYSLTAENQGPKTMEVSFLATQQNAVGYTGDNEIKGRSFALYGGNMNRVLREKSATILSMTQENVPGDMALATFSESATASASWESLEQLAEDFGEDGTLSGPQAAGPSPARQTLDGAIAVSFRLKPKEKRTVTFVLTWYFPNATHGGDIKGWDGPGNMYTNWWQSALEVARDLGKRLPHLTRLTRLYHDALYASNLPWWLLDRLSSQVAVLASQTCYWAKDGYFGGWEGCNPASGCCAGNCSHVWHYAQAHARLFPQIGRIMREQELKYQMPDGGVPHRQPDQFPAFDGQCGTILGAYREHLVSPDRKWLDAHWPGIKKAMDFLIANWDRDEDGVLAGAQWNTLDDFLSGSTSWLGSLYLAALAASERMALLEKEPETAARYRRIRESGSKKQDAALFNGEYYIQIPDETLRRDYLTGCHIDQVLGQWWADQLHLGHIYPPEHVRTALRSLFQNNFRTDFHGIIQSPRKFVDDDDAGMQMITWPKGGRPDPDHTMLYADEVMSGFEYSAAAAMVGAGLLREGFIIVRAASDRYDGRLRTGVASWGYNGNPFGDDECGKFYARPMSIWSMLLACQGFLYDGPAGVIGFRPIWKPEDHRSFFTAAAGWGIFSQHRSKSRQTGRIEVCYGHVKLKKMILALPEDARPGKMTVKIGEKSIPAQLTLSGSEIHIQLTKPVTLKAGSAIDLSIDYMLSG